MKTALTVGRYQPFHNGHLKGLLWVFKRVDHVIVGIGSSQISNTLQNPFSLDERMEMIKSSLTIEPDRYTFLPIPDIGDYVAWVKQVLEIAPEFDVVYTNASRERQLFQDIGCSVEEIPFYDRTALESTIIRSKIIDGDEWHTLVPKETKDVIEKIDGVSRIKALDKS